MSNDLVKRLRDAANGEHDMTPHGADCLQAADLIEELEAKLAEALELTQEALDFNIEDATLAELHSIDIRIQKLKGQGDGDND